MSDVILSIDQGTTSSRTLVVSADGRILHAAQEEFPQIYPADGWVEHDPEAIWATVERTLRACHDWCEAAGHEPVAIGITNQRETTLVWDRETGKCLYNAIVWQDRRTAERCRALAAAIPVAQLQAKTGLLHDPYFSATKIAWILDTVDGARTRAEAGELCFGTVESFLIWRLTGGAVHATDATNASRTNLYNIRDNLWDEELLALFGVPDSGLPDVRDCVADYGRWNGIPIRGVAGDQQAAAIGQLCFAPGDIKSTYGTGCFVILNTGDQCLTSDNKLLSTIAYRIDGQTAYALEGSIFIAGAGVQWLRDEMKLVDHAAETQAICEGLNSNQGVYLVPAFTGLGAPYWEPDVRGALFGLTRNTGRDAVVRATVESVVYQTHDLFAAMAKDGAHPKSLRVDGGMVANDWMVGHLSDVLNLPVERPKVLETTAMGAAYLAMLGAGMVANLDDLSALWQRDRLFEPDMAEKTRKSLLDGWADCVRRLLA
ncbi:glycerol kinase GlpK [Algimonas porphyrae]|uniref:Glycerol kinase 1 n=1 Tax=Algimonas porphyrae TaxID=1128113 RepID=A0ABQ5V1Z2_9PROT|nr:glycerol kinase GlpK [Algimonas porphyrae]GLQ20843.1 glycerol kinase 1 [Algimonas porphyrae]